MQKSQKLNALTEYVEKEFDPKIVLFIIPYAGLVSPVKNQGSCSSCAAFASASAIETCFKRLTGQLSSCSEQQYLDCAYDFEGTRGCAGAPLHAYLKWSKVTKNMTDSGRYPYKAKRRYCQVNQAVADMGAVVNSTYYTYNGTEELLKQLLVERSTVVASLWFSQPSLDAFIAYQSGVFNSCSGGNKRIVGGHAVAMVGYGSENGEDYWLAKNSWGTGWGDKGFFKLPRGVAACQIGSALAVVDCAKSSPQGEPDCQEGDEECVVGQEEEGNEVQKEEEAGDEEDYGDA